MALSSWHSAIARVYPVHLMNADSAPGGRQPSDQANRLGLWVRQYAAIIHIHHRHFIITQPKGWYSFYRPTEGRRLSRSQLLEITSYHICSMLILTECLVWRMWTSDESCWGAESWAGAPTSTTSWFHTVPLQPRRQQLLQLMPTCIADCDTLRRVSGRTTSCRLQHCRCSSSSTPQSDMLRVTHFTTWDATQTQTYVQVSDRRETPLTLSFGFSSNTRMQKTFLHS